VNIPPQLLTAYNALLPLLSEVELRLNATFGSYTRAKKYPFVLRVKTIESTAEKVETGRYKSFSEIDDLIALTVIVPSLGSEQSVVSFCEKSLLIVKRRLRGAARKGPDSFRFDTTRLYCRMRKPEGIDLGEPPTIYDILFEVQIRTAFEHAWIVATHDLTYKGPDRDWRKMRLAAQMKAAVEQLDLLTDQFEALAPCIPPSQWQETDRQNQICEKVRSLVAEGVIPQEVKPHDLSRFAENILDLLTASDRRSVFPEVLVELEAGFREVSGTNFPRSATLLQIAIGILASKGQITGPFRGEYVGHITNDLVSLYPSVRQLGPTFHYS
jgi:ppGpp synthetase/RelA/SpoT-type nucleotidyltranferase